MSFACSLHLILRINIMAFVRMRESRFHAWFIRSYVEFVAVVDVLDRIAATISRTRLQCRHWQPGSQQKWEMKWRCLLHINNSSLYKRSFVAGVRAQPKTLCSLSHWRRCVRYQKVIFLFSNALRPLHHRTLIFFCFSDSDTQFSGFIFRFAVQRHIFNGEISGAQHSFVQLVLCNRVLAGCRSRSDSFPTHI